MHFQGKKAKSHPRGAHGISSRKQVIGAFSHSQEILIISSDYSYKHSANPMCIAEMSCDILQQMAREDVILRQSNLLKHESIYPTIWLNHDIGSLPKIMYIHDISDVWTRCLKDDLCICLNSQPSDQHIMQLIHWRSHQEPPCKAETTETLLVKDDLISTSMWLSKWVETSMIQATACEYVTQSEDLHCMLAHYSPNSTSGATPANDL